MPRSESIGSTSTVGRRVTPLALAVAAVLAVPATAHAQAALEEVVVTAQKREQRIQDVPISITAIGGDELDLQSTRDARDILRSVAGLSYAGSEPGQTRFTIRGVSTAASSPTTGVFLDDVSLVSISTNFAGAIEPPVFDLERIEVLKGPQGTLYGGSAMGGAIKYVSRRPDLNATTIDAAVGFAGTRDGGFSWDAESVLNVPLSAGVAGLRVGVLYRDEAGWVDYRPNLTGVFLNRSATTPPAPFQPVPFPSGGRIDRDDANGRTNLALKASVLFQVGDDLTILPAATLQRSEKDNPSDYWSNLPGYTASYRMEQPTDDDVDIFSLTISKEFAGMTLTSLSGWFDRSVDWVRDYTYFVAALVPPLLANDTHNVSSTSSETLSQELRLASNDPAAKLKWTAGLFYSDQDDVLDQVATTLGGGAFFGTGTDVVYIGKQSTKLKQYAAFGDVTYAFTDRLEASVGLRWFDIEQTINGDFDGVFNGGPSAIVDKRSKEDGLNPKVSVSYRYGDDKLAYASASKGFRPGGPNRFNTSSPLCAPDFQALGIDRAPATFDYDNLWTYEVGSKNTFDGNRLLLNGAVFFTDWKKIQQQVNLPSCGFQFVSNVGAAEIMGAELEFRLAATEGFTLGGALNYTDSEITETALGVSAKVGQPVLDTPKWNGSVFVDLEFPEAGGWQPKLRADWQFRSKSIRQFDSLVNVFLPSGVPALVPDPSQIAVGYEVLNVGLTLQKGTWQAQVYVNNVTDESAAVEVQRLFNTANTTTLRPRTIGVSLRTSF